MKSKTADKKQRRVGRRSRIRAKLSGTAERPRLCVFRSNKYIYAQLIDDTQGKTIAGTSSFDIERKDKKMSDVSYEVGTKIAEKARELNVEKAVFDRGGFPYAGNIQKLATGARDKGLIF